MKKIKIALLLFAVLLVSCSKNYDVILDDAGHPHYTTKLQDDKKGQDVFPKTRTATGEKVFIFDPNEDAWAAYSSDGQRVMTGRASGGADTCPDKPSKSCRTVTGQFRVLDKKGPDCHSSEFPAATHGGARMPYCMHFHNGFAIHAAYDVPNYNASHGCIRVLPGAAKWLNQDFMELGTKIVVLAYNTPDDKPLE